MNQAVGGAGPGEAPGPDTVLGVRHSAAAFAVPRGACDCHVHVFGPPGRYAFAADRVFMPDAATVDDLVGLQVCLGLDRVVIVQASPQGTDNRCLVDALDDLRASGRAARGVAVVDERIGDAELQWLHDAGVRGLRVNLQSYGLTDPALAARRLEAAAARAAEAGWHVQVYTNLATLAAARQTVMRLRAPLVVDHFALADAAPGTTQPGFADLLAMLSAGQVYVKLSAPYRIHRPSRADDARAIARALIDASPGRMLWGTDWPHTGAWPGMPRRRDTPEPFHPIDDGEQLNLFGAWTSERERRQILVDNPAALYGFDALPDPG